MALLHPDKLVGLAKAIQSRPTRPRPSIQVAAQRVATGQVKPYKPLVKPNEDGPTLIENLAHEIHRNHEERVYDRMARRADTGVSKAKQAVKKPVPTAQPTPVASQTPQITISLAPPPNIKQL